MHGTWWRFHDSDYNVFELHWYHVLNISQPRVNAFSFWYFTLLQVQKVSNLNTVATSRVIPGFLQNNINIEFVFCV